MSFIEDQVLRAEDRSRRPGWGWGLLDQALSSLTNFLLVLLVARRLGAFALGSVAVGFAGFALLMVTQRALVGEPLVITSEGAAPDERMAAIARGEILTLILGAIGALTLLGAGAALGGPAGAGLRLFSPWVAPAILQDYWRAVLFKDGRGGAATLNDATWTVVMALLIPLAWHSSTVGMIVTSWGVGALAGALLGHWQTKPPHLRRDGSGLRWLSQGWSLKSWFLLDKVAINLGSQGGLFLLAGLLPAAAIGGLRSTQSVFAPLTILGPAVSLPGLPTITRRAARSTSEAKRLSSRLSLLTVGSVLVYVGILFAFGRPLLDLLFGDAFGPFSNLILPVAAGQVAMAVGTGFVMLLKAHRAGRYLFLSDAAGAATALIAAPLLASTWGIVGGAWGLSTGMAVAAAFAAAGAWRSRRHLVSKRVHGRGLAPAGRMEESTVPPTPGLRSTARHGS